ncbi:MAG: peptidoglycan-binding domain-containing protein [Acidimicrobiaceae bacterium]|nr:peptidoglycan-binding domain-containing protein [Acidimicrobiaceae bacterium]
MRTHLQGTFLLIVLLLVFWGMLGWAVPIIDDAIFGDDGAIVARAPQHLINPNDPAAAALLEANRPLEGAEVADLQEVLLLLGYDPGPVDGIMGELTRAATKQAEADLGLSEASDREMLEALETVIEAQSTGSDTGTNSGTGAGTSNSADAANADTGTNSGTGADAPASAP